MHSVRLIHWNLAEAQERAERLRALGYAVDAAAFDPVALRALRTKPPAAIVIDLSRLPSHGRDVALAVRQSKATRQVPLVLVEGEPAKVARLRALLPDAVYSAWSRLAADLPRAIAQPLAAPLVPRSALAGYSGTPLPKKLGVQPNSVLTLLGAPPDFPRTLGPLPVAVTVRNRLQAGCGLVLWFVRARRELDTRIARLAQAIGSEGVWIIWPKQASGVATDVTQSIVRAAGLAHGLVDYKICAVDATWSGLKFARKQTGA